MEETQDYEVQIPFKLIETEPIYTKLIEISDEDKLYLPSYEESERSSNMNLYKIKVYGLTDEGIYLFITRDEFRSIGDKYYCFIYAIKYGKIQRKIGIYETNNKDEDIEKLPIGFIKFFPIYYVNKEFLIDLKQDMYSYVIEIINNKKKTENGKKIGNIIVTDIWNNSIKKIFQDSKIDTDDIRKQYIEKLVKSEYNKENKIDLLRELIIKMKENVDEKEDYDIIEKYFNINNYLPFLNALKKFEDTEISEIIDNQTSENNKDKIKSNVQETTSNRNERNKQETNNIQLIKENIKNEEVNKGLDVDEDVEVNKGLDVDEDVEVRESLNKNVNKGVNADENDNEDDNENVDENADEDVNENNKEEEDENANEDDNEDTE